MASGSPIAWKWTLSPRGRLPNRRFEMLLICAIGNSKLPRKRATLDPLSDRPRLSIGNYFRAAKGGNMATKAKVFVVKNEYQADYKVYFVTRKDQQKNV